MNNKQELFCCISGYEPKSPFSDARDERYFELIENKSSYKERIHHLQIYAETYVNGLKQIDCCEVDEKLQQYIKSDNNDSHYKIYDSLAD